MAKQDKINFIDYISCALRADADLREYEKSTKDILEKSIDENFIVHKSRIPSALSPTAIFYSLSFLLLNDWPSYSVLDYLEDAIMPVLCEFSIFEFKSEFMIKLQNNIDEYAIDVNAAESLVYQSNDSEGFQKKMKNKINTNSLSLSLGTLNLSDELGYEWLSNILGISNYKMDTVINNIIAWNQLISEIEKETSLKTSLFTHLLKMKNSGSLDKLE